MGVFDKIKNALFEVEYVEVDEPPKKEKIKKSKEKKNEEKEDKPIAKKIVLPGKKEEKVEEIKEEVLKDDDFEARPIDETVKEEKHEEFKYMDDNDFKVDEEFAPIEQPEIVGVIMGEENHSDSSRQTRQERNEYINNSFYDNKEEEKNTYEDNVSSITTSTVTSSVYDDNISDYNKNEKISKPYGVDTSYTMHEYGSYDRREEKSVFKPSPIISPIYGILDKNYKKEDVVQKKEVRLSSYTRSNMNVDDIRNKAYGKEKAKEEHKKEEKIEKEEEKSFELEEDNDENLLVDLSNESDRPEVKEVTMGDAEEYFQDLGLEYNVDYVDASGDKHKKKDNEDVDLESEIKEEIEKVEEEVIGSEEDEVEEVTEVPTEVKAKHEKTNVVEVKEEANDKKMDVLEDDDNLFDLIDSMYKEEN